MQIDISWDSSAAGAPSGFKSGIVYAVNLLQSVFTNSGTVLVNAGYGEVDGIAIGAPDLGETAPNGLVSNGTVTSFSQYSLENALPSGTTDAEIGFATSAIDYNDQNTAVAGSYDFIGIVEHELTHALGRISWADEGYTSSLDSYRYAAPGILATATSTTAYFSLDGGVTNLGSFATLGDLADWSGTGFLGNDALAGGVGPGQTLILSRIDFLLMAAIGYTLSHQFIGTGINLSGSHEYDLLFLGAAGGTRNILQYNAYASRGNVASVNTLHWQSNGAASPEGNVIILDSTSGVTAVGSNKLGYGGTDVTIGTQYGWGPTGTYEFTPSGSVFVSGNIPFRGSGDVVNGTAGAIISVVSGSNDTFDMSAGTVIVSTSDGDFVLSGSGDVVDETGSGGTIFLSRGRLIASGSAITLTGTSDTANLSGSGDVMNLSLGAIVASAANAAFTLKGSSNVVTLAVGDTINITGGFNIVNGSSVTVTQAAGIVGLTINGSNDGITVGAGAVVTVNGIDDILNGSSFTVSETSASADATVNGSDVTAFITSGATVTFNGSYELVSANSKGADVVGDANSSIIIQSTGATASFAGAGYVGISTGTVIATSSSACISIAGNADTVLDAHAGSAIGVSGASEIIYASGITIYGGANTGITVVGSADAIGFAGVGWVSASNCTINASGSLACVSISGGNNDIINASAGALVGISGANDTVNATGATIFETTSATNITINGDYDSVGPSAGSAVSLDGTVEVVNGSRITVNAGSHASVSIYGDDDVATAAPGAVLGFDGTGETVTASGITIYGQIGATLTLIASGPLTDAVGLDTSSEMMFGSSFGIGFMTGPADLNTVYANVGSQTVYGFNPIHGDQIDLSQILLGTPANSSNLSSFVTATSSGSNTTLSIAAGSHSDTILLAGAGALSLPTLISDGAFVYPSH